jgi:hypothetical protein
MRTTMLLSFLMVALCSCRAADSASPDLIEDAAEDTWWHGSGLDALDEGDGEGEPPLDLVSQDLPPDNTAPNFTTPPPVSLAMGSTFVIDLVPFLGDDEDGPFGLAISWSADHVALQELPDKQILVVAPVDWFGSEAIDLIATDSGGLTAVAPLKVIVTEVEIIDPPPPVCDPAIFSIDAGTEVAEVLLSGSFNEWGDTAGSAAVMTDEDGDGTWTVTLDLEPGEYLYKFIVDGVWTTDPANPDKVDDDHGGFNSVIEVFPCEE